MKGKVNKMALAQRKQKRFVVNARKWFDKTYGNTYHAVEVTDLKTGKVMKSQRRYGYGNQYMQTADELIKSNGLRSKLNWDNSVVVENQVSRRKDLTDF